MLDLEERNRARKKAMRLLEHMDRTEKALSSHHGAAGVPHSRRKA